MEAKQAVKKAMEYILDLYENENIYHIGLEEVDFNPDKEEWYITIGFTRGWDTPKKIFLNMDRPVRSFKVVRIHDKTNEVLSVKNHSFSDQYETVNS